MGPIDNTLYIHTYRTLASKTEEAGRIWGNGVLLSLFPLFPSSFLFDLS